MHNLVLLFLRFGHFILFVLLELFCLYLIVNYNRTQREIWGNSSNIFMGYSSEKWNDWTNYFSLRDKADALAAENALLKEKLINAGLTPVPERDSLGDFNAQYKLITAEVTNNSTDRPNNYIYFNKGRGDGIRKDMGVIGDNGVIGIITRVKESYSVANSLLHKRSFISAMIKRTGAFGDLRWIGANPRYVNLTAIPKHNTVVIGDTIVTSGYSTHFPKGMLIGVVEETNLPGGSNFHNIKIALSNNFSALDYVEIIENLKQSEQLELEREVTNE